jgi:hypothetical protein
MGKRVADMTPEEHEKQKARKRAYYQAQRSARLAQFRTDCREAILASAETYRYGNRDERLAWMKARRQRMEQLYEDFMYGGQLAELIPKIN